MKYRNVAFKADAVASSKKDSRFAPSNAVDGTGRFWSFSSAKVGKLIWIRIILPKVYPIVRIRIVNRAKPYTHFVKGFNILIDNKRCQSSVGLADNHEHRDFKCKQGMVYGKEVKLTKSITKKSKIKFFTLTEIEVYSLYE